MSICRSPRIAPWGAEGSTSVLLRVGKLSPPKSDHPASTSLGTPMGIGVARLQENLSSLVIDIYLAVPSISRASFYLRFSVSPLAPSPSSDLEGIRLQCASYGRRVLRLPRSLPRALRETLAQGGSSPGSPTQSGSTTELTVHSPIHLGGAPGIHPEPHLDVVGVWKERLPD